MVSESGRRTARLSGPRSSIAGVGIVTRNRPALLRRCLLSLAANLRRFERDPLVWVVDNSDAQGFREETRSAVERVRAQAGLNVAYLGADTRRRYAEGIAERTSLDPAMVVSNLVTPPVSNATGAGRNFVALLSAGRPFVLLDDDVVVRPLQPVSASSQMTLEPRPPVNVEFFASPAEALSSLRHADVDFLGGHETALGRAITVQAEPGGVAAVGRVIATLPGLVGDCAQESNMGRPAHVAAEHAGGALTAEWYALARTTRCVSRVADHYVLTVVPACMAYALGLDGSPDLPPFLPAFRNSDNLFALLLRLTTRDTLFCHLPWAVLHSPLERPRFSQEAILRDVTALSAFHLVSALLCDWQSALPVASTAARLKALGLRFKDLGASPRAVFLDAFQSARLAHYAALAERLRRAVSQAGDEGTPLIALLEDLRGQVRLAEEEAGRRNDRIHDLGCSLSEDERARQKLAHLLRAFGELLENWADLRRAAAEMPPPAPLAP